MDRARRTHPTPLFAFQSRLDLLSVGFPTLPQLPAASSWNDPPRHGGELLQLLPVFPAVSDSGGLSRPAPATPDQIDPMRDRIERDRKKGRGLQFPPFKVLRPAARRGGRVASSRHRFDRSAGSGRKYRRGSSPPILRRGKHPYHSKASSKGLGWHGSCCTQPMNLRKAKGWRNPNPLPDLTARQVVRR